MALGKRERNLAWVVGGVAALYLLDVVALQPYFDQQKELARLRLKDVDDARALRQAHHKEAALLASIQKLPVEPEVAEQQVLKSIKDWAEKAGVTMSSIKPERTESKTRLREIVVTASGTGSNEAMINFLFKLQTADFPLRILKLQLGAKSTESEDLALQLRISTLYLAPEKKEVPKKDSGKKVAESR